MIYIYFYLFVGWDQTEKSIKIYITLAGVESVPKENIKLDAVSDSFDLYVLNLNKKNHHLNVKKLLEPIDPSLSSVKVSSRLIFNRQAQYFSTLGPVILGYFHICFK